MRRLVPPKSTPIEKLSEVISRTLLRDAQIDLLRRPQRESATAVSIWSLTASNVHESRRKEIKFQQPWFGYSASMFSNQAICPSEGHRPEESAFDVDLREFQPCKTGRQIRTLLRWVGLKVYDRLGAKYRSFNAFSVAPVATALSRSICARRIQAQLVFPPRTRHRF
jgi:hypothetical protein